MTSSNQLIQTAQQYLGVPYQWGGVTPNGFDCSGLIQYVFAQHGKFLPRVTYQQEKCGKEIPLDKVQAGDLYFWGLRNQSYHVALACGKGIYLHAPAPGQNVKYGDIRLYRPNFAIRLNP